MKSFVIAFFHFFIFSAYSQTTFQKTYGGPGVEYGTTARPTTDGGYVIFGSTASYGSPYDFLLIKINQYGDVIWSKTYDVGSGSYGLGLQQLPDKGYILAGWGNSCGSPHNIHLIRVDSIGTVIWSNCYEDQAGGHPNGGLDPIQVKQTYDGGFVTHGFTNYGVFAKYDMFLTKVDASGNFLWGKSYGDGNGGSMYQSARSMEQVADSGFILAGFTDSGNLFGAIDGDLYVVKTDKNGNLQWAKSYGGPGAGSAQCVGQTKDGGYILAGWTDSFGAGGRDVYLIKTDQNGTLQWSKTYGGSATDMAYAVQQTSDGGYIVTGLTASFGLNGAYVIKTDNSGNLLWSKVISNSANYTGRSVEQTTDGGYIIGADVPFSGGDLLVIKMDKDGNVNCNENTPPTIVNIPATMVNNPITMEFVRGSGQNNPLSGLICTPDTTTLCFTTSNTLTASVVSANINCNNQCTGAATVTPTGGAIPYTYSWNSSLLQTTQTATGLCAGYYTVTVTDATSNTTTATVTITQPAALSSSVTITNVICNAQCNGSSVITASGGTSGYAYNWSTIPSQTTANATGLCAGTYMVMVIDVNSCTTTQTVTITQPALLSATATVTNSMCDSNNGSATVTAGGGTPGYTYSWSTAPLQTTQTATGLGAGIYTATVTDANNCTSSQTVTVVSSGGITVTGQSASICFGSTYTLPGGTIISTGGAYIDTLVSTGGCDSIITTTLTVDSVFTVSQSASICTGFTYTLPGGTVVSISGTYNDTITSVTGCDSIITTSLAVNPNPTANTFSNVTITQGQNVTLTASGGGTYSWSSGSNNSSIIVIPFVTTVYCVTVTDSNNCKDTACATVTIEPIDCSNAGELYLPNAFSPSGDGENDKLQIYYGNLKCIKIFNLVIYNRWGEKVFETNDSSAEWDGSFREKTEGTAVFVYYLKATLISGEEISRKGNISLVR